MDNCPLSGKPCNKYKNIQFNQNVDGEIKSYELCQECGEIEINPISYMVLPLPGSNPQILLDNYQKLYNMLFKEELCSSCKISKSEIKRSGKLGCPHCYDFYQEDMKRVIPFAQNGNTKHKGKRPKTMSLVYLKEQMSEAISQERYEDAATLRDQIKELEKTVQRHNVEAPK